MYQRVLMATVLISGVSLAACSGPPSQSDQNQASSNAASARRIELVTAPAGEAMLASDLEARRAPKPAPSRTADRRTTVAAGAGPADAKRAHDHVIMAATAVVPEVGRTTSSMVPAPMTLAAAPLPLRALPSAAPAVLVGTEFGVGGGPSAGSDPDPGPGPVSRGPTIIIRGGMGSPHDDCKIHGQGARGPGMAINRIAPSFAPSGGGFGNSGITGSSGARFPRGGIR